MDPLGHRGGRRRLLRIGIAAAMGLGICSTPAASAQPPAQQGATVLEGPAAHRKALQRIEALIGDARCTDHAQCRVAAVGALPCGSAEIFLPWSTAITDPARLEPLLAAFANERARWHQSEGLSTTCRLWPMPAAICRRDGPGPGRCTLGPITPPER